MYNRTGAVHVEGLDPEARVHVHVFNSGGLREIGSFKASNGIRLGPADYVMTAESPRGGAARLLSVQPDADNLLRFDAGPAGTDSLPAPWMEEPFWIRIPMPPASAQNSTTSPTVDPAVQKSHELALARNDLDRLRRSQLDPELTSALAARLCASGRMSASETSEAMADLLARLATGGPHESEWARFLVATPAGSSTSARFSAALDLVLRMDDKDYFECDTTEAREALALSEEIRAWREQNGVAAVPDTLWFDFVLSPRIDRQPGSFTAWRTLPVLALRKDGTLEMRRADAGGHTDLSGLHPAPPESLHACCARLLRKGEPTILGPIASPEETFLPSRSPDDPAYATPASARVAWVGLFRRNGIPARVEPERRWVECFVDGRWIPADPFEAGTWNHRPDPAVASGLTPGPDEGEGTLEVDFTDLGAPMRQAQADVHFTLAHFSEGRFLPLYRDLPASEGKLSVSLEPGDWWLMGGQRNHAGNARLRMKHFKLRAGESLRFSFDLGIPPAEREAEDLASRPLSPSAVSRLRSLSRVPRESFLALVWTRDSEPCRRTADVILSGRTSLSSQKIQTISIELADGHPSDDLLRGSGRHVTLTPEDAQDLFQPAEDARLPYLFLIDADGRTRLALNGMQLAAMDLVRQAMAVGGR